MAPVLLGRFDYLLRQQKERLNRALAHLSYDRLDYDVTGKGWNFVLLIAEIQHVWAAFLKALPEERRDWFVGMHS
jgi:hypothetical protein